MKYEQGAREGPGWGMLIYSGAGGCCGESRADTIGGALAAFYALVAPLHVKFNFPNSKGSVTIVTISLLDTINLQGQGRLTVTVKDKVISHATGSGWTG